VGDLINFTKRRNPCPICGNDWCAMVPDKNGSYDRFGVLERRMPADGAEKGKYIVHGMNGRDYVFKAVTKSGAALFQDAEEYLEEREAWLRAHGYGKYRENKPCARTAYQASKAEAVSAFGEGAVIADAKALTKEKEKTVAEDVVNFEPKSHKELDKIYRFMMSRLTLEKIHADKYRADGWTEDMLRSVKSSPLLDDNDGKTGKPYMSQSIKASDLAKECIIKFGENCLEGVPGAYRTRDGRWSFAFRSGVVFPMYDFHGYIYRLRIRMDFLDVADVGMFKAAGFGRYRVEKSRRNLYISFKGITDEEGREAGDVFPASSGKYRTLASRNFSYGTPSGNEYSLYGNEGDNNFLCYIIEGEPKAMFSNFRMKMPAISISGVNSWMVLFDEDENGDRLIDALYEKGVETFVVAFDADAVSNEMVQRQKMELVRAIKGAGYEAVEASWQSYYKKDKHLKGLDDLLAAGYSPKLRAVKLEEN